MKKPADEEETTAVIHVTRIKPDNVEPTADFDEEAPTQVRERPVPASIETTVQEYLARKND